MHVRRSVTHRISHQTGTVVRPSARTRSSGRGSPAFLTSVELTLKHRTAAQIAISPSGLAVRRCGAARRSRWSTATSAVAADVGLDVDRAAAIGTAARDRDLGVVDPPARARSIVRSWREVDLRRHEQLRPGRGASCGGGSGRSRPARPRSRARSRRCAVVGRRPRRSAGPSSRSPRMIAITTSRTPIAIEPTASHRGCRSPRPSCRPTSARTSPISAPVSSSSTTGSSGDFALRMNHHQLLSFGRTWFASLTAVRSEYALEHDRERRGSRTPTTGFSISCGWRSFCDALVQREQAAHAEQHQRDDERPEVALRPVAERVRPVRRAVGRASSRTSAAPGCRCPRASAPPRRAGRPTA